MCAHRFSKERTDVRARNRDLPARQCSGQLGARCTLRHERESRAPSLTVTPRGAHGAIRSLVSLGAGRFRSALELVDVFCSSACVLRTLFLKAALDFFAEIAGTGRQFCLLGLSPTRRLRSYNNLVNKRDARRRACSCTCSVEARPLEVRRMYKHASPYTLSRPSATDPRFVGAPPHERRTRRRIRASRQ